MQPEARTTPTVRAKTNLKKKKTPQNQLEKSESGKHGIISSAAESTKRESDITSTMS